MQIKKIIVTSLLVLISFVASAEDKETIEYRAQVWVEKEDLARYGGEEAFNSNLDTLFHYTTRFWNESENKFNYFFKFIPVGLHIYDIEGDNKRYDEFKNRAFGELDTELYDFVLFFALNAPHNGLSCGGGGKSGQSVVMCYQTLEQQQKYGDIFTIDYPKQGTYSNLGHEYGHVRGATDIYQYIIRAEDNPVSHQALMPPKCNMGNGMGAWSDYCSHLFNYTAHQKQLEQGWKRELFPDMLKVTVKVDGKTKKNVPVKFYGTRAGGKKNNRDVYPIPYREYLTNRKGNIEITDSYALFHPERDDPKIPPHDEFSYGYWFSFVIEAEYKGEKKYFWLRDWDTQISKMEGKNIHEVVIEF